MAAAQGSGSPDIILIMHQRPIESGRPVAVYLQISHCHVRTGTGLATSAPGPGSPPAHLRSDWARPRPFACPTCEHFDGSVVQLRTMSAPMVRSRSAGAEVAHRRPRRERRVRWPTPSPPLTLTPSLPLPALAAPTIVRCDGVQVPRIGSFRPRPVADDQTTAVGGQRHAMEPSCNAPPIHRHPIQTRACSTHGSCTCS